MCTSDPLLYESKDYPSSPTNYSLVYSSSTTTSEPYDASPGYCSPSSSSSSVSNGSSVPSTPEPENKTSTAITVNKNTTAIVASKLITATKKQYQCPKCLKNFSRPSALQTHSYTHTSEKPFQCLSPGCGRRFSVVSNLRRHFKVHQKPSVGNKLSSEDRLRYVRQLIINSDSILAKQQQQQKHQQEEDQLSLPSPTFNESFRDEGSRRNGYDDTTHSSASAQQEHDSSVYLYQHYLSLPAIHRNNQTHNHSNSGFPSAVVNQNNNTTTTPLATTVIDQNTPTSNAFLFGSSAMNLPYTWSNSYQVNSVDQNAGGNGAEYHHNFAEHHQYPSLAANIHTANNANTTNNQQQSSYYTYMNYNSNDNNESSTFKHIHAH